MDTQGQMGGTPQPEPVGRFRRRGMMAGLAALAAGALVKASEQGAEATHGNTPAPVDPAALHVNRHNIGTTGTVLAATAAGAGVPAFRVWNDTNGTGTSTGGIGLQGESEGTNGLGVYGVTIAPGAVGVRGASIFNAASGIGVEGLSGSTGTGPGTGVHGKSGSGTGVLGQSTSSIGVRGDSSSSYGVAGITSSGIGTAGVATAGGIGLYARSESGRAVSVESTSGPGVVSSANVGPAIQGTSSGGIGVYGVSTNSTGGWFTSNSIGVYATAPAPGLAARFDGNVQVNGTLTQTGGAVASTATHTDGSERRLYGVESPESWVEDFGRDRLENGRARVRLDPDLNALVRGDNYHVVLTPEGDCNGLYVSAINPNGFEVRELKGGTSNLPFSYRVVAKRRDARGQRLERVERPEALQRGAAPGLPTVPTLPSLPDVPHTAPPAERGPR